MSKLARNICEKFNLVLSLQIAGKCWTRVFGGVEFRSRSQCFDDKQRDGRWPSTKDNKNIIFGRCVRFVNIRWGFWPKKRYLFYNASGQLMTAVLAQRPLKGKTDLTWQPLALRARGWIFDAQTKKTNRPLLRIKEVWRVECQQSYWSGW